MTKTPAVRLLEVTVTPQEPTLWKWQITEADLEVAHGYSTSRETAQIDGDTKLFAMLFGSQVNHTALARLGYAFVTIGQRQCARSRHGYRWPALRPARYISKTA